MESEQPPGFDPARTKRRGRFEPFSYPVRESQAPFLTTIRYLRKNPLQLITADLHTVPVAERKLLGRRALLLNDPDLTRYFFSDRSDVYTIDPIRKILLRPGFGSGLASVDGPAWTDTRVLTRRYFKPEYLERYATVFQQSAQAGCSAVGAGETIQLQDFFGTVALGGALGCLFSTRGPVPLEAGVQAFNDVMKHQMSFDAADLLMLPAIVPRLQKGRARRPLRNCRNIARAIVDARLKGRDDGKQPADLLSGYFDTWISGDRITARERKRIQDNVGTMIGASFETTALSMTWTLYFLLNCPASMALVREELAAGPHLGKPLTQWPRLLPRLTAALMETLRIYPILPAIVRYATEEDRVHGLKVEPGNFIVANLWTQHRDERHWPEARVYKPERFMGHSDPSRRKRGYFPFGLGPRGCIGTQFAILEAVIVLATVLEGFRLDDATGRAARPQWRGTLRPDRPIRVKIRKSTAAA